MSHDSRFKRVLDEPGAQHADVHSIDAESTDVLSANSVRLLFNGQTIHARTGDSVAAAIMLAGAQPTRYTAKQQNPRAPYCMMGVCFECLMSIDGVQNLQACMVSVKEGMVVESQSGVRTENDNAVVESRV